MTICLFFSRVCANDVPLTSTATPVKSTQQWTRLHTVNVPQCKCTKKDLLVSVFAFQVPPTSLEYKETLQCVTVL